MIPKIIHQIWFQDEFPPYDIDNLLKKNIYTLNHMKRNRILNSNIPNKYKLYTSKMFDLNPDYYYFLWNEKMIEKMLVNNKIWGNNNLIKKLYYHYDLMIQKIDMAKYLILFLYGGFYVDVDVEFLKPFDALYNKYPRQGVYLSKSVPFLKEESNFIKRIINFNMDNDFINNGIMISEPRHPFWINLLNHMSKHKNDNNSILYDYFFNIKVFNTTGPAIVSTTAYNSLKKYSDLYILPNKYFEPCVGFDRTCVPTHEAITNHKHNSQWYKISIDKLPVIFQFIFKHFSLIMMQICSNIYFTYLRGDRKYLCFSLILILYISTLKKTNL